MKSSIHLLLVLSLSLVGAEYQDKNIDGKKYLAEVKSEKGIYPAKVEFHGKQATDYLDKRTVE